MPENGKERKEKKRILKEEFGSLIIDINMNASLMGEQMSLGSTVSWMKRELSFQIKVVETWEDAWV